MNVHGRKYPWKQIIAQVERIAWHTKKTKFKKMLAIDLSENCMPCPSYMKLYNLVYSTSVKSRNIFKEYNWFCKCSFERYKIQGLSDPLKPKETETGKKARGVWGLGVILCLTSMYCIVGTTPGAALFQVIPGHAFEIYCWDSYFWVEIMACHSLQNRMKQKFIDNSFY